MKIRKRRCGKCNNVAVWFKTGSSNGMLNYCDDCVPRGCSCNIRTIGLLSDISFIKNDNGNIMYWGEDDNIDMDGKLIYDPSCVRYELLDDNGKRNPCNEYDYESEGDSYGDNVYGVSYESIDSCYHKNLHVNSLNIKLRELIEIYLDDISHCKCDIGDKYDYRVIMGNIRLICEPFLSTPNGWGFYDSLRNSLYGKRELIIDNSLIY